MCPSEALCICVSCLATGPQVIIFLQICEHVGCEQRFAVRAGLTLVCVFATFLNGIERGMAGHSMA